MGLRRRVALFVGDRAATATVGVLAAVLVVALGGCGGGMSDVDAIEQDAGDRWQRATVESCDEEPRKMSNFPDDASFYACDVRNLSAQERSTLMYSRPTPVVRVCFVVLHDELDDVLVLGPASNFGFCAATGSGRV